MLEKMNRFLFNGWTSLVHIAIIGLVGYRLRPKLMGLALYVPGVAKC